MGRRSRKSKRRMNSLFMALLLSAVLLIMSTYAWFTANRVVTINGITAKVTVAEGLQISIDGEHWANAITVTPAILAELGTASKSGEDDIAINNWQWPSELKPVSTDGTLSAGIPLFKDGAISTDGLKLQSITAVNPTYSATVTGTGATTAKGEKLIVFDVYLRNTSGSSGTDTFELGAGSKIDLLENVGVQGTGLENSSRVGVLLYGNTVSTSAQNQYDICNLTVGSSKFAIWEPNYTSHIADTVSLDARLSSTSDAFRTRAIARGSATTINDVVDTTGTNTTDLIPVKTTHTDYASDGLASDVPLLDVNTGTINSSTGLVESQTELTLARNAVSKAKIYIWLEGQDPDCNDYASAGGGLQYVIKFTKPAPQQGG